MRWQLGFFGTTRNNDSQTDYEPRFLELMAVDKKAQAGRVRLVLLREIGNGVVTDAVDPAVLGQTIEVLVGEAVVDDR